MGLPPSLLDYAENIWRRFPEAFFALGVPQLEDVFEVNKGSWRYRIVDTSAEKVVEIVLPRRKSPGATPTPKSGNREGLEPRPGSFSKSDEVQSHSPSLPVFKASNCAESSLQGVPWDSERQALGGKLATQVGKLGLDISNMQKSIKECVSREIQSQLREVRPRKDNSTLGSKLARDSSGSLLAADSSPQVSSSVALAELSSRQVSSSVGMSSGRKPEAQVAVEDELRAADGDLTSPTGSAFSWTSSLAARRGVRQVSVDLGCIEKSNGGPECVKRSPLLARTAVEQDGNEQTPNQEDGSLPYQLHHHVALADGSPTSSEPAEASSPGTELMMRARRRKERHREIEADRLEKSAQNQGVDTYEEADETGETPEGSDMASASQGFEAYWKSVNAGSPG